MLLSIHGLQTAMKYHFKSDNHAHTCVIAPLYGFSLVILTDITTHVVWIYYSYHWDGPGASYIYFAGIASSFHCIMAVSCIYTLLEAISKDK